MPEVCSVSCVVGGICNVGGGVWCTVLRGVWRVKYV